MPCNCTSTDALFERAFNNVEALIETRSCAQSEFDVAFLTFLIGQYLSGKSGNEAVAAVDNTFSGIASLLAANQEELMKRLTEFTNAQRN